MSLSHYLSVRSFSEGGYSAVVVQETILYLLVTSTLSSVEVTNCIKIKNPQSGDVLVYN